MINLKDHMWLDSRIMENKMPQPIRGIVGVLFSFLIFYVLWWVFMDPRGIMRWYTPQYGYMYIRWILIVAIWQALLCKIPVETSKVFLYPLLLIDKLIAFELQ